MKYSEISFSYQWRKREILKFTISFKWSFCTLFVSNIESLFVNINVTIILYSSTLFIYQMYLKQKRKKRKKENIIFWNPYDKNTQKTIDKNREGIDKIRQSYYYYNYIRTNINIYIWLVDLWEFQKDMHYNIYSFNGKGKSKIMMDDGWWW